jgi:hypothetical protein
MLIMPEWLRWSLEWSVIGLPLGVYFLLFGSWQYQLRQPALVRGDRDLLGLLLGLSGFFLFGPPTWWLQSLRWSSMTRYWVGYAVYLLVLALLGRRLLRGRQQVSILYAVHAEDAAAALSEAVKVLGEECQMLPAEIHGSPAVWERRIYWPSQDALLDVRIHPSLRTATLRWLSGSPSWRQRFQEVLSQALADKDAANGLATVWLLAGAVFTGLGVFHLLVWALLFWLRP